ncbi:hypothetical protein EXIGLDRAFT_696364 [Exidia glandulosa HHB12029]|uniref:Uncharacterized protein n=1 Tax=Exidia glandulosa HHB12029 TaxID=1314781 RepID=A0A166A5Y8_EXIGL|nr:hypothetical protein EXIGLDRAFT_696364 [Exidia glandulosa HHB12029]
MALTATATPVPAPAWDEQIVPALRKRLEAESRMLTKRMSMISTSGDDWEGSPPSRSIPDFSQSASASSYADERRRQQTYQESRLEQARASPVASRPSAIPRPSLQYSRRDNDDQPSPSPTTQRQQRPKRTRTQSTPGLHNLPTPASSRSNSPMVAMNAKPSRIPTKASPASPAVPRMPTNGAVRKASNTTAFPPSPETSPDLFLIPAATRTKASLVAAANSSRSSFEYPPASPSMRTKQSTEIIHEPPPFASYEPGRLSFSNDEGERPFEHWYRGESRRNGGVGEVKIATQNDIPFAPTHPSML